MTIHQFPIGISPSSPKKSILLVESDPKIIALLHSLLSPIYQLEVADDCAEACTLFENLHFDCLLSSLPPSTDETISLVRRIRRHSSDCPLVVMCSAKEISRAVLAVREGAADFIITEVEIKNIANRISGVIERCPKIQKPESPLQSQGWTRGQMVSGNSYKMQEMMKIARKAASLPVTVLLLGESGTGKELMACWIHRMSNRSKAPFVAVNLAAIPPDLIESTLFGHEKGSFTGALGQRTGKFGQAQNGTLLLDEISELKLDLQPKLLRVLQENEYERVGGDQILRSHARLIAATNQDLSTAVNRGTFRNDLFYRLNAITITLPPLRERREDIPELARLFLAKYNNLYNRSVLGVEPDAMEFLEDHQWPGNIRELENTIQRAVIMAEGEVLTLDCLVDPGALPGNDNLAKEVIEDITESNGTLEDLERQYIEKILHRTNGHQGQAVKILGIDRKTLYNKIVRYGLSQFLKQKIS